MPALKIPSTTVQPLSNKTTAIEIAGNNFCLPIPIVYIIGFNYCTIPQRTVVCFPRRVRLINEHLNNCATVPGAAL